MKEKKFLRFVVKHKALPVRTTKAYTPEKMESARWIGSWMCPELVLTIFGEDKNLPEFEQAWTVPEGSRRLRLPDFMPIGK